jgi:hypothetical protein
MSTTRGPGPPAPAHRSMDFIKCRSLATGSTAQIKPLESVSWLLILVVYHRSNSSDGWLWPGPALAHARTTRCGLARRLTRVWVFLSYGGRFSMRFAPHHNDEGNMFMLTLIGGERQWSPAMVRQLTRCLSTVRAASGEDSAPRTCAKASSSSLLASRPTNCSDRRRKTRIWWLSRVWWVLDLRLKIHTICGAIYRRF